MLFSVQNYIILLERMPGSPLACAQKDCGPHACSGVRKKIIQSRENLRERTVLLQGKQNTVRELVGRSVLSDVSYTNKRHRHFGTQVHKFVL